MCWPATATPDRVFELASVTKPLVARAAHVAVEEGVVDLDTAAGPPGSTVRHLLAHASGLAMLSDRVLAKPGTRRDLFELRLRRARRNPAAGVGDRVRPLPHRRRCANRWPWRAPGWTAAPRRPVSAPTSTVADLAAFAGDLLRPSTVSAQLHAEAITVQFRRVWTVCCPDTGCSGPTIGGWVSRSGIRNPRIGRARATRSRTYGHFGQSGGFIWADPESDLALVVLTDRDFGDWALDIWPAICDAVISDYS